MTPLLEQAQRLLRLARSDRDAFFWLLEGPGLRPAAIYFFAQQSAEKALKSVMTFRELTPTRTHDLLALAAELNANGVPTPRTPDQLAALNPYAVAMRYDEEDLGLIPPDEVRELVDALLDWAERQLAMS